MDNERGIEETWSDWDGSNRNVAVGTILASALVAGVIAYVIRRRPGVGGADVGRGVGRATTAALGALGDDRFAYPRELLTAKVLPSSSPALLAPSRSRDRRHPGVPPSRKSDRRPLWHASGVIPSAVLHAHQGHRPEMQSEPRA